MLTWATATWWRRSRAALRLDGSPYRSIAERAWLVTRSTSSESLLRRRVPSDQLDELPGGHLAVAGEVPHRRPAQGPREWVGQLREIRLEGLQRAVVEAEFGEREVTVIEEDEIADALAHQLVDRRQRTGQVRLDAPAEPQDALGIAVVQADPGPVRAQRRMCRDSRLLDHE